MIVSFDEDPQWVEIYNRCCESYCTVEEFLRYATRHFATDFIRQSELAPEYEDFIDQQYNEMAIDLELRDLLRES